MFKVTPAVRVTARSMAGRLSTRFPGNVPKVTAVRTLSSAADQTGADAQPRRKYKSHFKRASSVMADIKQDSFERMKRTRARQRGAPIPHFEVGDAVQVRYSYELSDPKPARLKGIVIAKTNKGIESKFTIMNAVDDDIVTQTFPYSSPLLKEVKVYKKWHLHGGRRRARRAKLYYLIDKPADEWLVK